MSQTEDERFCPREHAVEGLIRQCKMYTISTRRLFQAAGISSGMKVLTIGCGPDATTLLAGEMVGAQGSVTCVDASPFVLEIARKYSNAFGVRNVSFVEGNIANIALERDFDAVVGRNVLLYERGDRAAAVRNAASHVRAGGIVALQEVDLTAGIRSVPHSYYAQQMHEWMMRVGAKVGMTMNIGAMLHQVFLNAGLPLPQMHSDAPIGVGADSPLYEWAAESIRNILPLLTRFGIATTADVEIDRLAERFRNEVVSQNGIIVAYPLLSAWARKA